MSAEIDFEAVSDQEEHMQKDNVMKTAWIRISKINHTGENKDIIQEYTKEKIVSIVNEWNKSTSFEYALCEHVPDEGDPNDHSHLAMRFSSPTRFSVIKSKFPFCYAIPAKNFKKAVQYLIHMNHPEKKQYSWDDVVTNIADLTPYKVKSKSQQDIDLQRVFEKIESGEITPYNYSSAIPIDLYAKNERIIQSAFNHKISSLTASPHRKIRVLYFYGKSRIGKSRLAYDYAKAMYPDEEPANSSAENDPLQDYKGQKVLIWNEFRDSHMKYSNLLSFIDPHYRSSGKSRYHNKPFLGDVIIFTSTQAIDFLYKNVQTDDGLAELRNRITEYHEFVEDKVKIYLGDGKNHFVKFREHLNPYYGMPVAALSDNENTFNYSVYEKLGISLSEFSSSVSSDWLESKDGQRWIAAKEAYRLSKVCTVDSNQNGLNKFGGC